MKRLEENQLICSGLSLHGVTDDKVNGYTSKGNDSSVFRFVSLVTDDQRKEKKLLLFSHQIPFFPTSDGRHNRKSISGLPLKQLPINIEVYSQTLTYCILVEFSTVICWTSPFIILGALGLFCCLVYFLWKILCHIMWRQTPYYVASDLGLRCLPMATGSQVRMGYQLEQ